MGVVVDFHTHVFPPDIKGDPAGYFKEEPYFGELYDSPSAKMASAEDVISSMDAHGVNRSIILNFGWKSHQMCVETNDYILDCISRYSDRLVGFCAVQPGVGQAAVAEIKRCALAGARGIGELMPDGQGFDLGHQESMYHIMKAAQDWGLLVMTHASEPVGHHYRGKGNTTPEVLYRFVSNFPQASIILSHWGGGMPFYSLMPEVAEKLGKVYFDTAATTLLYRDEIFVHLTGILGADRILFGTDFPLIDQGRLLGRIRRLDMAEEDQLKILGLNAAGLLGGE